MTTMTTTSTHRPSPTRSRRADGRGANTPRTDRPDCFAGASASGGRDGPGVYRRKHAPAISFDGIRERPGSAAPTWSIFSAFKPGDVELLADRPEPVSLPRTTATRTEADTWLAGFAPKILDSDAFAAGGLLVVTFDEDARQRPERRPHRDDRRLAGCSGRVQVGRRRTTTTALLRTVQDAWGLDCLAESCSATPMREFFGG